MEINDGTTFTVSGNSLVGSVQIDVDLGDGSDVEYEFSLEPGEAFSLGMDLIKTAILLTGGIPDDVEL